MKEILEYEINKRTMFLRPVIERGKRYTLIVEVNDVFLCPLKIKDILRKSCVYYGVDYESRRKGTRHLIGYKRKLPITIEPSNRLFFFPTASHDSPECIWISSEHVEKPHRAGPRQTEIFFRNKQSHHFPVSVGTIEGQLNRTRMLKDTLLYRIEGEKKHYYFVNGDPSIKASETRRDYD